MTDKLDAVDIEIDEEPDRMNSVVFPRKLLKKFILLFKSLRCLWDRCDPMYKQKYHRHEAISQLTKLVQEHDPSATRVHVMRKIESLRACVRREHKKVRDSRIKATCPADEYKPTLWYYDLFSFVFTDDKQYIYVPAIKVDCKAERAAEIEEEEDEDHNYDDRNELDQSMETTEYASAVVVTDTKHYPDYEDKEKRLCTEVEDEYDAIGINVAAKLRYLPHNMRILAEKLINDVLYQAQLNALNSTTTLTTQDPFKPEPL